MSAHDEARCDECGWPMAAHFSDGSCMTSERVEKAGSALRLYPQDQQHIHEWVFLREVTREAPPVALGERHQDVPTDVFFCRTCLEKREVAQ